MKRLVLHKKSVLTLELHRKNWKTSFSSHRSPTASIQWVAKSDYFDSETQYPQATIIANSARARITELTTHAHTNRHAHMPTHVQHDHIHPYLLQVLLREQSHTAEVAQYVQTTMTITVEYLVFIAYENVLQLVRILQLARIDRISLNIAAILIKYMIATKAYTMFCLRMYVSLCHITYTWQTHTSPTHPSHTYILTAPWGLC